MKIVAVNVALAMLMVYCSARANTETSHMDQLAARYKQASSEKERMNICIEAIEREVVCRGCSIKVFDAVFGTSFIKDVPAKGEPLEPGVLDFVHVPPPSSDNMAALKIGWYLVVEFDSNGIIQNYYLSNLHK